MKKQIKITASCIITVDEGRVPIEAHVESLNKDRGNRAFEYLQTAGESNHGRTQFVCHAEVVEDKS